MGFSLFAILAVILEVLRPLLPLLLLAVAANVVLLVVLLRTSGRQHWGTGLRATAAVAGLVFVAAVLALPPFTGARFSALTGALDWLGLLGAALAIALACAALCWAPLQLLLGRR